MTITSWTLIGACALYALALAIPAIRLLHHARARRAQPARRRPTGEATLEHLAELLVSSRAVTRGEAEHPAASAPSAAA
jgi:hypothetical protein